MKKIQLFIVCIILLSACKEIKNQSFTGMLTYSVKVEILNDSIPSYAKKYLNQKYGDSVEMTYDANGSIRMQYFGSGGFGYEYQIYDNNSKTVYSKWKGLDTLYFYRVTKNPLSLISMEKKIEGEQILINLKSFDTISGMKANQKFYFIKDSLNVDPNLYKGYNDFFRFKILNESKHHPIKTELESDDLRLTRSLISVNQMKNVGNEFFKIPKDLPRKKY